MSIFSINSSAVRPLLRGGSFKGIEIYDDEIDRSDAMLSGLFLIVGVFAAIEQAAVDLGMEGLYAAAEHFGPACEVGDVAHGDTGFAKQLRGATGRKNLDAQSGEPLCELHDTRFIEHADERALHRHECLPKKKSTTVYALGGNSERRKRKDEFEIRNTKFGLGFDEGF